MNQSFTSFQEFKRRYPIRPNDKSALLGSGSYGRVVKVEDQLETEWVAIKISEFKGADAKSLKAEVELAQRVPRQANIARYDACYRLETDTSVSDFAIMKYYADGNLADLLQKEKLSPTQIYDLTRGILLGLQHLHRHHIVHRDFKPANILISRDNAGTFVPKIADFGLSKLVSEDELDSSDFDLSDGRGTPSYKAPEQIEGSRVSFNLDLWAFGVILYEMLTGEKPFRADLKNSSEQSVRREIEQKIISVDLPDRINSIAEPYASMIRRCLVRDIRDRVRKEDELLDLLDHIPTLLADAKAHSNKKQYTEAINLFEQILSKREKHPEAQKGIAQCKSALDKQLISQYLNDAGELLNQQQFEQAQTQYEQVLQLDPTNADAARGLVVSLDRLRPKFVVTESESTDVYQDEAKTDVFIDPVSSSTPQVPQQVVDGGKERAAVKTTSVSSKKTGVDAQVQIAKRTPSRRLFPWRIAVPAAIGLSGIILFISLTGSPEKKSVQNQDSTAISGIKPTVSQTNGTSEVTTPGSVTLSAPITAAITKRVDIALGKASFAFQQKDYATAIMLTNSALQLDPTRQDVFALKNAALKAQPQTTPAVSVTQTTELTEVPKVTPPVQEPEAIKAPEPASKEALEKARREAQEKYDLLIDDGHKAITKSNNKEKAKENFTAARALAKEYDLSTTKADIPYTYSMGKGNSYFDRDEFDGAKAWFQVAQSLKDTEEVKRRISQCSSQ
ncbi:hypothetical protein GCM10028805_22130 [Spirosoma harenae]